MVADHASWRTWVLMGAFVLGGLVWLMLVAVYAARAQDGPWLGICQPDMANVASIELWNFGASPVPPVPPSGVTPVATIPIPPTRTPVPVEHQALCPDDPTTAWIVVDPRAIGLTGPGLLNRWVAWARSRDGVLSVASNVKEPTPLPMTPPRLIVGSVP